MNNHVAATDNTYPKPQQKNIPPFKIDMEQTMFSATERKEMYKMFKWINLDLEMGLLSDPLGDQPVPFDNIDYYANQIHNMGSDMFGFTYATILAHYMAIIDLKVQLKIERKESP